MARTTIELVRGQIPNDSHVDLVPLIQRASRFVDDVVDCAAKKGITLTAGKLQDIETLITAGFYFLKDPQHQSRSSLRVSGSFALKDPWEMAKAIDPSGCVAGLLSGKRVSAVWLGKRPSEAVPFADRS